MSPQQVQLVRNSLAAAAPQRNRLAGTFLARLFARDPSTRFLLGGDPKVRGRELYEGLAAIVGALDRLGPIVPALEWLAVRAAARGVGEKQLATIAEILVSTLESGLGDAFTEAHRLAWAEACRRIIVIMTQAIEAEPLAA